MCNVLACLPTTWTSCERKRSKYLQCLEQHEGLISNDGQPTPSVYLIFFSNELKKKTMHLIRVCIRAWKIPHVKHSRPGVLLIVRQVLS